MENFFEKLPIDLNDSQKSAVEYNGRTALLLAVPGGGKTTVLTARIGYMILELGVRPESILVLTYTVAAAADMKRRFAKFFGDELAGHAEFRTINGIAQKIIMEYERQSGRKAFSVLSDEKKKARILADIYRELNPGYEYPSENAIGELETAISYAKNMNLDTDEIKKQKYYGADLYSAFERYNEILIQNRLMDYNDQMVYALKILKKYPSVLRAFTSKYKNILVDEAQDTSFIQHEIIVLLAQNADKIFMVGDEDQSIYAFRGAYPDALTEFEKRYSGARVFKMETNFRSVPTIVERAESFIIKNKLRHAKRLISSRKEDGGFEIINAKSRYDQFLYLAHEAEICTVRTGVLYRDNDSALPLIDILLRENIPFSCRRTDTSFFTNKTVLDIISILKLILNPCDGKSFKRVYYKLNMYVKKEDAMNAVRTADGGDIFKTLLKTGDLNYETRKRISAFARLCESLKFRSAGDAVSSIIYGSGYSEYIKNSPAEKNKAEILMMLSKREKSIGELIERLRFLKKYIDAGFENKSPFWISTIHSSKGLEYDNVFLIDVFDGILPAETESYKDYEEERRLFYVGITRARNNLTVFKVGGKRQSFLGEISGSENVLCPFSCGEHVFHNEFGEGTVTNVTKENIHIKFGYTERVFALRLIIEKELLRSLE